MGVVIGAQELSVAKRSLEERKLGCLCPVSLYSFLFPLMKPAPGLLPYCHAHMQLALSRESSLSRIYEVGINFDSY